MNATIDDVVERDWGRSELADRLYLMQRALARPDRELFGNRARYEETARQCAARLIAGESTWSPT